MIIAVSLLAPNNWFLPEPMQTPVPSIALEFDAIRDADSSAQRLADTDYVNDW